ncbi:MAG: HD domain-containing phosphohydrolase [Elusimicrobiales bacterium]
MNIPAPDGDRRALDALLEGLMNIHATDLAAGTGGVAVLCQTALDSACELTGSKRGSLMLFDDISCELKITASRGIAPSVAQTLRLKPGEGAAGLAFETGESIIIREPKKHPAYIGYCGRSDQKEPIVSLPIRTRNKVFGVMNLHLPPGPLPDGDCRIRLLCVLAGKTAASLENMHLNDSLQNFYIEMVETLARVIDAKDSYTHDHAGRARRKARRIAQELRLAPSAIRHVEYAALLHDIGKIGVSEVVLRKPGKLTAAEFDEIRRHPVIGWQILSPVTFLSQVSQMVLYHQEHFDGRGYPEGLAGKAIPLGARIVSAIDAWDAMVSDRPYRRAMSREDAVKEMRRCSGAQFDPDVVKTFLHLENTEWRDQPPA